MKNMILVMFEALITTITYIIAYRNISPYKFRLRDYGYMTLSIMISCYLLSLISWNLESIAIYSVPIAFVYMKVKNVVKSIIVNVFVFLIIIFNSAVIGLIATKFFVSNISENSLSYYIVTFIIYVSLFLVTFFIGKIYRKYRGLSIGIYKSKYGILICIILIITFFMFYININWSASSESSYLTDINSFTFIIYFLVLMFMCGTLVFFINKEVKLKSKQMQFQSLQEYTKNLEDLYMDMRKFRHDYINILSSVSGFLDENDIEGLKKYFYESIYPLDKAMEKNNFKLGLLKNVEIMELKGLLSAKLIRAQELELNVNIDIAEPITDIKMDKVDLIRVIGILLDNAIEAATKSNEKRIEVGIVKKEFSVIILVVNSYEESISPIYQMFKEGFSTKGGNRGLGLGNMRNIVDQYRNITLDTLIENNSFIQCINISNKD